MKTHFNTSKGKIAYRYNNQNLPKTILLLHGFMEDHEVWNNLSPNLNANVIMLDLLGFGESEPVENFHFTMQEHAEAINELLEFLKIEDLYVLGHSMGGYITLELSLLIPDINIGLLHSTCAADTDERKSNRNKTIQVLERDPSLFIREFYWNLFAEHRKNEFSERIETMKRKAEKIPVENIIKTVRGLRDRKDHTHTWKLSGGNNIMIGGTYDKLINVEEIEELAFLGGATWVELTDSGHMGFYEEPENLMAIVNHWLE
jgi:pimeloyl-ACP methyl ester carboxylesterase